MSDEKEFFIGGGAVSYLLNDLCDINRLPNAESSREFERAVLIERVRKDSSEFCLRSFPRLPSNLSAFSSITANPLSFFDDLRLKIGRDIRPFLSRGSFKIPISDDEEENLLALLI